MSSTLIRWGPLAAMLSGVLVIAKGAAIIVSGADPSLVPPGDVAVRARDGGLARTAARSRRTASTVGVLLAWIALAASAVNLIGLALSIPAPGDPDAPTLLEITYMVAFLGILFGLLALGIAALSARVMPSPWHVVPLAVGALWFPLQGVGFAISDGVGLVLGGLAWTFLGYVLWSQSGASSTEPSRVR